MKLYATITSERASKGQGGKWLEIEILDEYKKPLGIVKVFPQDQENRYGLISYNWRVGTSDGWQVKSEGILEAKDTEVRDERGKQQKGDKWHCDECRSRTTWTNKDYAERGNPVCLSCGNDMTQG